MTDTIESGYRNGESRQYRNPIDVHEMITYCDSHNHIEVLDKNGKWRTVKVNGKVRTWKRDANRIEIPCKYGLYEYFVLRAEDIASVLIPVEDFG
jgi:hypothetical protein